MKAVNLKVEYMTNPIGISYICPRFSWTKVEKSKVPIRFWRGMRMGICCGTPGKSKASRCI